MKGQRWHGMTLIELLATVAIIGIVSALAIPPFRGLQARETLSITQRGIQSSLYRMQQLALAPPNTDPTTPKIIGYGLAFHQRAGSRTNVGGCSVTARNDFIALYKFVVRPGYSGEIDAVLNPFDPGLRCGSVNPIDAARYPNDFYILPDKIKFNASKTTPSLSSTSPWLMPMPLESAGASFGQFALPRGYVNPLTTGGGGNGMLTLEHSSVRLATGKLCRNIQFSRDSNGVTISSRVVGDCT